MQTTTVLGRYQLSETDRRQKALELAEEIDRLESKRRYKAELMKDLGAEIAGMEGRISQLSKIVRDGWEYRHQECTVEKDYKAKLKNFVSIETGEVLKVEAFGQEDFQLQLVESR